MDITLEMDKKKYCSRRAARLYEGAAVSRGQGTDEHISFCSLSNVQNIHRGAFNSFKNDYGDERCGSKTFKLCLNTNCN